jgi:hypothetical protein
MAQRGASKAKKRPRQSERLNRPNAAAAGQSGDLATGQDRVRALEAEIAGLKAENQSLRSDNRALEEARDHVLNRIAWIIDSLHNLTER